MLAVLLCFWLSALGSAVRAQADSSPTPTPAPTPPPQTPAPAFVTAPPAAEDFPHINRGSTPVPTAQPASPTPAGVSTEAPPPEGMARITADQLYGKNSPEGGFTALGHVDLAYADAEVKADQAVYDAKTKILRATGHVHFTQANGDAATAQALEYESDTDRVTMFGVEGQTAALFYQGQQIQGHLYYRGSSAVVDGNGHTIIRDGWLTTCELSHVAYHITGKEIEVRPHDRLIVRHSSLWLGKYVVAALGIFVLPLTDIGQRQTAYAPRVGYNSSEGFFVRNFINFYHSQNLYGTYHVDYFTKVGLGLGADIYFQQRNGRGGGSLTIYQLRNNAQQQALTGSRNSTTAALNLTHIFSDHLTGALQFNYSGTSAVFTALPATTTANLTVTHNGARSTTSYILSNVRTGPSSSFGAIFNHTIAFSPTFSQSVGLNLLSNTNPGTFSRAVGLNLDTHVSGRAFDADLVESTNHGFQTTNIDTPAELTTPVTAIQRVPELTLRARPFIITSLRLPVSVTLIDGNYNDQFDNVQTTRYEANAQLGPGILRIGNAAVLNASVTLRQDAYGTGDLLGSINEQFGLQQFFGHHADNTLSYTATSVRGFTPLPSLDRQFGSDQVGEVLNVYNSNVYRFSASTSYDFHNKFLSPINYQLNLQPNPYALVTLGTSYDPHGTGYSPLAITLATPLTANDYLQFSGNYDFKLHGLQGQNYFLSHTVSDCYQVRLAYRQPLKEWDISLSLLAFPNESATFGINNNGPILAQGI
ncbi:MAG: hypothetical protein M3Z37_02510 [Candidatus Eremiobacteraeota bacterium]|nr:hypothetical protein [Candidatus Eremiobacteraeota bacterium]